MTMYGRLGMTGAAVGRGDKDVWKADTTMTDDQAKKLVGIHGRSGTLPRTLSREDRMAAHEARYLAGGGKKDRKWKNRAKVAGIGSNVGLGLATASAAGILAGRGKRLGPALRKLPGASKVKQHHLETTALVGAAGGGSSELYEHYAGRKRAKFASSPAGYSGGALTRMRNFNAGES